MNPFTIMLADAVWGLSWGRHGMAVIFPAVICGLVWALLDVACAWFTPRDFSGEERMNAIGMAVLYIILTIIVWSFS